jgi:hypothetical protein
MCNMERGGVIYCVWAWLSFIQIWKYWNSMELCSLIFEVDSTPQLVVRTLEFSLLEIIWDESMSEDIIEHNRLGSSCFQVDPVTRWHLSVLLGVNSIDSSTKIGTFSWCLELQPVISQTQLVHL